MLSGPLSHSALLGLVWLGGGLWLVNRAWRGGAPGAWLAAAASFGLVAAWIRELSAGGLGPGAEAQWLAMAALLFLGRPDPRAAQAPSMLSLLPLALIAWQGAGATLSAALIAATGALEPGRRRRGLLLLALGAQLAAAAVDAGSLRLWIGAMRHLSLGQDAASAAVDLGEQALRAAAWLALLGWLQPLWGRSRRRVTSLRAGPASALAHPAPPGQDPAAPDPGPREEQRWADPRPRTR